MKYRIIICCLLITCTAVAQKKRTVVPQKMPMATLKQQQVYSLDVARPIEQFDANPSGSLWYIVDKFGLLKTITINGKTKDRQFNEIPVLSTRLSPNGNYLVWTGFDRKFDEQGFNTTLTTLFRCDAKSCDSIGAYTSDFGQLFFTPKGDHWAATLPAANVKQEGQRDVVVIDGKEVASGNPNPRKFSFSSNGSEWAYRSDNGKEENLITSKGKYLLYTKLSDNPYAGTREPLIVRFSPDNRIGPNTLDGRDYDWNVRNVATMYQTSYQRAAEDTATKYLIFKGKRQLAAKWIKDVQIDSAGKHIVYFAADTASELKKSKKGNRALVVRDGAVIAGPYDDAWRLFLSESGEHMAWTVITDSSVYFYLDGKKIEQVGEFFKVIWSPDEKQYVYATTDDHDKVYIVAGGKRSPSFDMIGKIGYTADGKSIEYLAIKYDKILHITQPL